MITFEYKKSDTDLTQRVGFVLHEATDNLTLLELVDADVEYDADEMELAFKTMMEENKANTYKFMDKFGLKYKNFKSTKMFNIEEI